MHLRGMKMKMTSICLILVRRKVGKKKKGPPTYTDWENAAVFVKFLKGFYNTTLKFSATLNITSNAYFHELCEMQSQLTYLSNHKGSLLSKMAASMKKKYDKYWGDINNVNCILLVAPVLDPRFKVEYLTHCFSYLFDQGSPVHEIFPKKVKDTLYRLFEFYSGFGSENGVKDSNHGEGIAGMSADDSLEGRNYLWGSFSQKMKQKNENDFKNEIERYLADPVEDPTIDNFDLLSWWKLNCSKFNVLSQIARDVLAIPVSTVASESAFSTGGRILDPFRSSLSPKTVEELICTQNWLRGSLPAESIDLEKMEAYDIEDLGGSSLVDNGEAFSGDVGARGC
ncbi:unnamed protein product [Cuscuta europaea]|uniref:HAT C-terminal dimerisation domain-containing protein n=1 Tax=Cuscuta europaea TaxID=41803 RepID=A0A9P1EMI2_CUSEU|nr:unnamed protein product [Cuscuta europaea]